MATRNSMVIGDNSAATSKKLAEVFQADGFHVEATCTDGLALVEAAMKHRPSVVVLDLILPKLTGLQVIEALRRKGLDPTFVVVSAVSARPRVLAAKEAGASYYVLKPFDAARLNQVSSRLTEHLAVAAG